MLAPPEQDWQHAKAQLHLPTWNINGLRSKWIEASDFLRKYDIAVLTETKLDPTVTLGSLLLKGYATNIMDRNANGGGVASYIKAYLKPNTIIELQSRYKSLGIEITADSIRPIGSLPKTVLIGVYAHQAPVRIGLSL